MKLNRAPLILAVPLAALTLVACGDDDDEPAVTEPDVTVPDVSLPDDITIPSLPDISLPDISLPDVSLPDISIPDISIPDISIPDMTEIIGQAFPNLDEEQVSCLADALGDVGTDFDASQVLDLLGDCDIDPSEIVGG